MGIARARSGGEPMAAWSRARLGAGPAVPPAGDRADPSDGVLVAAAQADRQAFAPLYDRYVDPVYRYCLRRLGSREAAEDATSQVFAKALAALPAYRDRSFRGWLFTIAHNVVSDTRRQRRPVAPLADAEDRVDPASTPEEAALTADEGRALRALLVQLPADQRRIVELRLAGLTGVEIARVLGRSEGAVKMLQFRAVARLRVLLEVEPRPQGGTR